MWWAGVRRRCAAALLLLVLVLLAPIESSTRDVVGSKDKDTDAAAAQCALRPYSYLALEGGGVKGITYGGVIARLEQASLLTSIVGFTGSSAGTSGCA